MRKIIAKNEETLDFDWLLIKDLSDMQWRIMFLYIIQARQKMNRYIWTDLTKARRIRLIELPISILCWVYRNCIAGVF